MQLAFAASRCAHSLKAGMRDQLNESSVAHILLTVIVVVLNMKYGVQMHLQSQMVLLKNLFAFNRQLSHSCRTIGLIVAQCSVCLIEAVGPSPDNTASVTVIAKMDINTGNRGR